MSAKTHTIRFTQSCDMMGGTEDVGPETLLGVNITPPELVRPARSNRVGQRVVLAPGFGSLLAV